MRHWLGARACWCLRLLEVEALVGASATILYTRQQPSWRQSINNDQIDRRVRRVKRYELEDRRRQERREEKKQKQKSNGIFIF